MKKRIIVGLFAVLGLLMSGFTQTGKTNLTVKIDNIKSISGTIYISIFNRNGFPEKGQHILQKKIKVTQNYARINFEMPSGEYAIALYHDVNDNNEMDKNFFGYPLEPYAFSQNYEPTLSKPDFADCQFSLNGSAKNMTISLIQ